MSIWTSGADHTVVLLGAGASKGSDKNLPAMQGFFGPTLAGMNPELARFLVWFYGHENLAEYNVEDVLSYLELAQARIPKWTGAASIHAVGHRTFDFDLLLDYIADRLAVSGTPCRRHQKLIESLEPTDTVLTLNYDLVCDGALRDLELHSATSGGKAKRLSKLAVLLGTPAFLGGEPVALMPRETATGFYLKLHGSVDWLYCPNARCLNASRYYSLSGETILEGQAPGRPCRRCGNLLRMFLVPPVATKAIEHEGRLAFLWNLALNALAHAKRIVIIGVSFTASDQELRWLIRQSMALSGFPVSLDLVNPAKHHRESARALVRDVGDVRHFETLQDFLEGRQVDEE